MPRQATRTRIQTTVGEVAVLEAMDDIQQRLGALHSRLGDMTLLGFTDQYGERVYIALGHIVTMRPITPEASA